jgi:probable F420-dependent oxidoreductase
MGDRLKLGLYALHRGSGIQPDTLARRARSAEEAGFESLWVGDHIAVPAGPQEVPRLEALIALTALAAATSRVRLGVGLIVLPQRQPVLLAKQLTSLDVLSGGRLTVGIGAGYIEPELRAMGVALSERAARTEEHLAVLRALWRGDTSFTGRFVSFDGVVQRPGPVQRPHPPIVVGGHSPAAFRRAARHGNGWYGWDLDLDETARAIADLDAAVRREGRPAELGDLEITISPPGTVDVDTARRYADLGVHRVVLHPSADEGSAMEDLIAHAADTLVGRV